MFFPYIQERQTYKNSIGEFRGYNHTNSCAEGQFYDSKNMSSDEYPFIATRKNRKKLRTFTNLQGILTTNDHIVWIDNGKLFVDAEEKTPAEGITLSAEGRKTIAKLNTQIIIYPDKVWYDIKKDTFGTIEKRYTYEASEKVNSEVESANRITRTALFTYAKEDGNTRIIYGENASYTSTRSKISTIDTDNTFSIAIADKDKGMFVVKNSVDTPYIQVILPYSYSDLRKDAFLPGDFVKFKLAKSAEPIDGLFVNEEEDGTRSFTAQIVDTWYEEHDFNEEGAVTISFKGELPKSYILTNNTITVERTSPDMAYIIESNNRLWGCSADGHHIYASKLGDASVWNSFEGISTDAWETTVGSDGEFTGAITYDGVPMFFKEDRIIKITISSIGAHQTKEVLCRGVQKGSDGSLVNVSNGLIYKSHDCICGYNGAMPYSISDALGDEIFTEASAGVLFDKYFVSMKQSNGDSVLYVYDIKNAIWSKFDNVTATFFCTYNNDLLFSTNNTLYSIEGTEKTLSVEGEAETESPIDWYIETAPIGFYTADHKYVKKINVRALIGENATLYVKYDGGEWEKQYDIKGNGISLSTLNIIPRRCDYFCWKIEGHGTAKIYNVYTTLELGSDKV